MNGTTEDVGDDIHLAAAVLSKRYEDQLFNQGSAHNRVVPALVITGFLGSGKTTLVQHLLATCGSELKLGVLVNEVAHLDVDSQVLNTSSSNAAAGIKAAKLSGGCACCAVSDDLTKALSELVGSSSYQHLDHLVSNTSACFITAIIPVTSIQPVRVKSTLKLLETSGVADAGPLAASLSGAGFRLTGVVGVVDVEAGLEVLQQDIAQAQLLAADIVVLNKCDLACLATVSAVEDRVQELAPGVKVLRARFGQVPAEALLDVDVPEYGGGTAAEEVEPSTAAVAAGHAQGEIAFLSHEPIVSTSTIKGRSRQGRTPLWRRAPINPDHSNQQAQHTTAHQHSSFGSVSFLSDEPLCMACFQQFVSHKLTRSLGLFRAKGFVWFQQLRSQRYVFHFSGKQRVECGSEGRWQEPPKVQLVLIGQDQPSLLQLNHGLQDCVAGCCACSRFRGQPPVAAQHRADAGATAELSSDHADNMTEQYQGHHATCSAAGELAHLISQHQWLGLHPTNQLQQRQQVPDQPEQQPAELLCCSGGLVEFTAKASVLHGVIAEEVNSKLLQRANAAVGIFMCHVKSPAALQLPTLQHARYQGVTSLQLCLGDTQTAEGVAKWWGQFLTAVAPALKTAYQHVHNCNCDVAVVL